MRDSVESYCPPTARVRFRAGGDRTHVLNRGVTWWVLFCALCSGSGWGLSALHQLNVAGYAVVFGVALAAAAAWGFKRNSERRKAEGSPSSHSSRPGWQRRLRRFRRLCPFVFLVFAGLSFLAGALSAPNYYDALAYRIPRVLHWLAEGRWHWIHTAFNRVNARACGFEWVAAPVIAFTRSDRLLFLPSFISFLLLPGLFFGSFTRMGVRRRVAYHWMWLLPLACCFLLQAGTLGNDLFSACFALAAFDYALRARESRDVREFWLALLAAGLATGVKANTLPLLAVWGIILLSCWRLAFSRLAATLAVGALAAACSFVPTALLNFHFCHDWTGGRAERFEYQAAKPWARLLGNTELLVLYNFSPPVVPFASYWNSHIAPRLAPGWLKDVFEQSFALNGADLLSLDELQSDGSGLGLTVCVLLLGSSVLALHQKKARGPTASSRPSTAAGTTGLTSGARLLILGSIALATLVLMVTSFVKSTVRLLCPYYALLVLPFLLLPGHARIVRTRGWRLAVVLAALLSAGPLFIRPGQPLLPVQTLLPVLKHLGAPAGLLRRAETVYTVYGQRGEAFAEVVRVLPPDATVLGMVTYDDPESTIWKPFGSRRIVHVCPGDTPDWLRAQGVRYVLAGPRAFANVFPGTFEDWLAAMHGRIIRTVTLTTRAADGPTPWHIVELP